MLRAQRDRSKRKRKQQIKDQGKELTQRIIIYTSFTSSFIPFHFTSDNKYLNSLQLWTREPVKGFIRKGKTIDIGWFLGQQNTRDIVGFHHQIYSFLELFLPPVKPSIPSDANILATLLTNDFLYTLYIFP